MNSITYTLLGPLYSERKVAKFLKQHGYHVIRNTYIYGTPKGRCNGYAELDVIGLAEDHMVIVEVKSWKGQFFSHDEKTKKGMGAFWTKKGLKKAIESPYQQAKRARRIFKETLERDFMNKDDGFNVDNMVKSFIVLDRGRVEASPEAQEKWHKDKITVLHMNDFLQNSLPEVLACPDDIRYEFEQYSQYFKLPWYAPFLHKHPKLRDKYLKKKDLMWKEWIGSRRKKHA